MEQDSIPPCRIDTTPEDRIKEADRSVLYGALLVARRPGTRVKPAIADAVAVLAPAVEAYVTDGDAELAAHAAAYADACGGRAFMDAKRIAWLGEQL